MLRWHIVRRISFCLYYTAQPNLTTKILSRKHFSIIPWPYAHYYFYYYYYRNAITYVNIKIQIQYTNMKFTFHTSDVADKREEFYFLLFRSHTVILFCERLFMILGVYIALSTTPSGSIWNLRFYHIVAVIYTNFKWKPMYKLTRQQFSLYYIDSILKTYYNNKLLLTMFE